MKQDRKTAFRTIVTIASVVLCLVAFALFVVAIFADSSNSIPHQDDVKVHVYYLNTSVKIYRTKKLNNGSRVTGSAI